MDFIYYFIIIIKNKQLGICVRKHIIHYFLGVLYLLQEPYIPPLRAAGIGQIRSDIGTVRQESAAVILVTASCSGCTLGLSTSVLWQLRLKKL